jgi:hypothetical protein
MALATNPPSGLLELKQPRSIAIYDSYDDAQQAVDYLAERNFPVASLAIVGTDLRLLERVTGAKLKQGSSWGRAIVSGLLTGLTWGLMMSVVLWIFMPGVKLYYILASGIGFGLVYGVLASVINHGMNKSDREFTSATQVVATHYEIMGEAENANEARRLLSAGSSSNESSTKPEPAQKPGFFGQKSDSDTSQPPVFVGQKPTSQSGQPAEPPASQTFDPRPQPGPEDSTTTPPHLSDTGRIRIVPPAWPTTPKTEVSQEKTAESQSPTSDTKAPESSTSSAPEPAATTEPDSSIATPSRHGLPASDDPEEDPDITTKGRHYA